VDQIERKLAAILVADVAEFSRLAGADEEATIGRLRTLWSELFDPAVAVHRGRVVKRLGDGALVEFRSVVDAVRCALAVQDAIAARDAGPIRLRIGIHLGDIVQESDGDIMGDGVNIAARLEPLAESGGIVLSEDVYHHVLSKVDATFVDLGEKVLKNIARPMRIYTIARAAPARVAWLPTQASRLSLVVLPFVNLSGNSDEDYFADGITQDITGDLSRIPDSFVIARNTAFTYRTKSVDAKQVGRELGVRYVVEGSVRRVGNRVRANVQLNDAEGGGVLFAERFDCDRADLIELQDEVTARIAGTIGAQLIEAESRRSLKERPTDPDAVDLTMRGWSVLHRPPSKETLVEARALFEQAIALDTNAAEAVIGLAYSYARAMGSGFSALSKDDLDKAAALVARALAIAPHRAVAHWVQGVILRRPGKIDEAAAAFERAIALDRNLAPAYGSLGDIMVWRNRQTDAIEILERAIRLSPRDPLLANWQFYMGTAYWHWGNLDEATGWYLRARESNPELYFVLWSLAACYEMHGKFDMARSELAKAQAAMPWVKSVAQLRAYMPTADPKMLARDEEWFASLRRIGLPEK